MTSTHTPGPWTAHNNNEINYLDIDGGSSERICSVYVGEESLPMAEEAVANARLIAFAPDLLAALERLTHPMADDDDLDYARETIAKAKGLQ